MNNSKDQFKSLFKELARNTSRGKVFSDWLEIVSISLHQMPYHSGDLDKDNSYALLEEQYLKIVEKYSKKELSVMTQLMAICMSSVSLKCDFLGELFMDLEIGNAQAGQFFTPFHVSKCNALITMGDVEKHIKEEKRHITISDPAVGAGGMLIAAASVIHDQKHDPRIIATMDAIDISRDCFNMCYIQLSLLGLQAIVHHGNTISMEIWESRPTYQLRLYSKWLGNATASHRITAMFDAIQEMEMSVAPDIRQTDNIVVSVPMEQLALAL